MAVLTTSQLSEIRRGVEKSLSTINYNKLNINAALQAIENWYESNKTTGSAAIDTATFPFVFTTLQKKRLFAYWMLTKFVMEGV